MIPTECMHICKIPRPNKIRTWGGNFLPNPLSYCFEQWCFAPFFTTSIELPPSNVPLRDPVKYPLTDVSCISVFPCDFCAEKKRWIQWIGKRACWLAKLCFFVNIFWPCLYNISIYTMICQIHIFVNIQWHWSKLILLIPHC